MVRLMLVLAPIMCILSGVAVSNILRTFLPNMVAGSSAHDSSTAGANLSNTLSHKRPSSFGKQAKNSIAGNYSDPTYPFKSQVSYRYVQIETPSSLGATLKLVCLRF